MTLHAEAIERTEKGGALTADGLLRRRASQRPGATALCDPPNLEALGFGPPKNLSYRTADAAVDALAAFLIGLGLEPGDTVAVQLPNLAMSPLTLLGAWRAGLTVAAVPMLWRAEEIAKVCEQVAPEGSHRRCVLRRREACRGALRDCRLAAVGALRARLWARPA